MVNEQDFINNLKRYDPRGTEFDDLSYINDVIKGNIRPITKRGLAPNEFTTVKLAGFEHINDDTVLNLFDVIPPGPKELERSRTHLVVGRYSQAIVLNILLKIKDKEYLVLQERHPLCFGFEKSTEVFRDYIPKNITINQWIEETFEKILEVSDNHEIIPTGYFWENTGVLGTNINSATVFINISAGKEKVLSMLNTEHLTNPDNVIGKRDLILIPLKDIESKDHYLTHLISIASLSILSRIRPSVDL